VAESESRTETAWPTSPRAFLGIDPGVFVLAGATLAFSLAVQVVARFVPEYLNRLGASAELIGLYASFVLLCRTLYPYLAGSDRRPVLGRLGRLDELADRLDTVRDGLGERVESAVTASVTPHRLLVAVGALSASGTLLWLVAPQIGDVLPVPAWLAVAAGTGLVLLWGSHGPGLHVGLGDVTTSDPPDVASESTTAVLTGTTTLRLLGFLALLAPTTLLFASVAVYLSAFQVLTALTGAVGFTAVGAFAVLGRGVSRPGLPTAGRELPTLDTLRGSLSALNDELWTVLAGNTAVTFAEGMVHVFLIVVVTEYHAVGVTVAGTELPPVAFFGLLVAVETVAGLAAVVAGTRIAGWADPRTVIAGAVLSAALFPLLLIGAPSHPAVLAILFALFGVRFAAVPARAALFDELVSGDGAERVVESCRLTRNLAAVPGGVVGGLLYGIAPEVAFGIATLVGLFGAYQFLQFVRLGREAE
jgi:hypothetical protein